MADKFEREPKEEKDYEQDKIDKSWEEKEREIEKMRKAIDEIADYEGKGIDKKIKSLIVVLSLTRMNAEQSCQGYYGEERGGIGVPWISIATHGEPRFRFRNEDKIFEKVAKAKGFSLEEIEKSYDSGVYEEAMKEIIKQGETEACKNCDGQNKELWQKMKYLLGEFYENRNVADNLKIKVENFILIVPGSTMVEMIMLIFQVKHWLSKEKKSIRKD